MSQLEQMPSLVLLRTLFGSRQPMSWKLMTLSLVVAVAFAISMVMMSV